MNICAECKHCKEIVGSSGSETIDMVRSFYGMQDYVKVCEKTKQIDVIDGEAAYFSCLKTRKAEDKCGPNGNWFEKA